MTSVLIQLVVYLPRLIGILLKIGDYLESKLDADRDRKSMVIDNVIKDVKRAKSVEEKQEIARRLNDLFR